MVTENARTGSEPGLEPWRTLGSFRMIAAGCCADVAPVVCLFVASGGFSGPKPVMLCTVCGRGCRKQ